MLVLARLFEEGGLSTVLVTMMPSWAEQYGVPRALAIEYPFAHPLGMPHDEATQTRIIRQALDVLVEAKGPNTIVHSPEVWPGNEAEWRKRWQPSGASPLVAKYLDEIRSVRLRARRAAVSHQGDPAATVGRPPGGI